MRKKYLEVFKRLFHQYLSEYRMGMKITQEEMAQKLMMGCRTYVDLDHGKSGCSALTLALFLIYVCSDPMCFLKELKEAFESSEEDAA